MSPHALQLLWNVFGPASTRCAFTGVEIDAVTELRALILSEAKKAQEPTSAE